MRWQVSCGTRFVGNRGEGAGNEGDGRRMEWMEKGEIVEKGNKERKGDKDIQT